MAIKIQEMEFMSKLEMQREIDKHKQNHANAVSAFAQLQHETGLAMKRITDILPEENHDSWRTAPEVNRRAIHGLKDEIRIFIERATKSRKL